MVEEADYASDPLGLESAITYYGYDNRNRLTSEQRVDGGAEGVPPVNYNFQYDYDAGGNRLHKVDLLNNITTTYHYDVSAENDGSADGNQHNNRLLSYESVQTTTGGQNTTLEQGWYHYGRQGHVQRLVKHLNADGVAGNGALRVRVYEFHYDKQGRLWIAVSLRGELGLGGDPDTDENNNRVIMAPQASLASGSVLQNCEPVSAMEYRYDASGRRRYLVRPRKPHSLQVIDANAAGGTWQDYAGDDIYGDYGISISGQNGAPQTVDRRAYLGGVGFDDATTPVSPDYMPCYTHADQIGTIRRITGSDPAGGSNPTAQMMARATYTAFGESLDQTGMAGSATPTNLRYGYAGDWGYAAGAPQTTTVNLGGTPAADWGDESGNLSVPTDPMIELGWLHVGERYYDPACGRFVMRDPIGILGGLNTYAYCAANPATRLDPRGTTTVGLGVGGQAIGLPFSLCVGLGITFDFNGNILVYVTGAGPILGIGLGAGVNGTITVTNAGDVTELLGPGSNFGITAPIGTVQKETNGTASKPVDGVTLGIGPGVGGGVYGQPSSTVGATTTWRSIAKWLIVSGAVNPPAPWY